jgi:hypothetical protein
MGINLCSCPGNNIALNKDLQINSTPVLSDIKSSEKSVGSSTKLPSSNENKNIHSSQVNEAELKLSGIVKVKRKTQKEN